MRTTFEQPSINASDVPSSSGLGEEIATLGTVFVRTHFGEHYLRPSSIFFGAFVLAGYVALVTAIPLPSDDSGMKLAINAVFFVIGVSLILLIGTHVLLALATFLILPGILVALGYLSLTLSGGSLWASADTEVRSAYAFFVLFALMTAYRLATSLKHDAPLANSAGRSSSLLTGTPSGSRMTEWAAQQFFEPMLFVVTGAILVGVFGNRFGFVLLLVAMNMSAGAEMRFSGIKDRVTAVSASLKYGEQFSELISTASAPRPPSGPDVFVARPVKKD